MCMFGNPHRSISNGDWFQPLIPEAEGDLIYINLHDSHHKDTDRSGIAANSFMYVTRLQLDE